MKKVQEAVRMGKNLSIMTVRTEVNSHMKPLNFDRETQCFNNMRQFEAAA